MLRVTGRAVRIESKPWSMTENGATRTGVTTTVRVLVGEADFVDVRYTDGGPLPVPDRGEELDLAVVPAVSGRGQLQINARALWADVAGEPVALPAPRSSSRSAVSA